MGKEGNIRNIMGDKEYPKTGIAVMIMKDGKILLGKRKCAHGAGNYTFPCEKSLMEKLKL